MDSKKAVGRIYIGTSNITLPGNKQTFPPEWRDRSRLSYYASLFNTVEINSSFYKIPLARTFARWTSEVPEHFRFTVKLFKGITHCKNLAYDAESIRVFLDAANELGVKKGCLLVQFPKSISTDYYDQVRSVISSVREADPHSAWRLAVEFREAGWVNRDSWYGKATQAMLDEFSASMVVQDIPASRNDSPNTGAPFVYMRMHGIKGDYRGSYPTEELAGRAMVVREWTARGQDVFINFNNTIGTAFDDARALAGMLQ
jgi:uncharacterized protein YecE (DUF72 family)